MPKRPQLQFASFDGEMHARLGFGNDCVLLTLEKPDYTPAHMHRIVLTGDEAIAMGRELLRQGRESKKVAKRSASIEAEHV